MDVSQLASTQAWTSAARPPPWPGFTPRPRPWSLRSATISWCRSSICTAWAARSEGGSGRRTGPCSRLGSATVAFAGQVDRVALVRAAHLDVDDTPPILLALVDHLASEDVGVADVVELADLRALRNEPAVVTHEVRHVVAQPAVTHHPVVIGHRVADGLRPGGVPVDPLGDIGHPVLILDVEGGDALTVLVRDPVGAGLVGHEAVPARVEDDHVGRRQGAFGHRVQRVADVHVLPVAGLRPLDLLSRINGIDLLYVLVGVGGRLEGGVLPFLPGRLAFGVDGQCP